MNHWLAVVAPERYADEVLYARPACTVAYQGVDMPAAGDPVLLVAASAQPLIFAVGVIEGRREGAEVTIAYRRRLFDQPIEAGAIEIFSPGLLPVDRDRYERLAASIPPPGLRPAGPKPEWFVSVSLPIEADSRAEAVREFWTYVEKLGPRELPALVWPRGDEMSMQAFVLGAPANQDPEGDDD
jgi:hypothetical protein